MSLLKFWELGYKLHEAHCCVTRSWQLQLSCSIRYWWGEYSMMNSNEHWHRNRAKNRAMFELYVQSANASRWSLSSWQYFYMNQQSQHCTGHAFFLVALRGGFLPSDSGRSRQVPLCMTLDESELPTTVNPSASNNSPGLAWKLVLVYKSCNLAAGGSGTRHIPSQPTADSCWRHGNKVHRTGEKIRFCWWMDRGTIANGLYTLD